jgi:pantoate--beta-alanine ligase
MDVEIIVLPTIREQDGLAMSSRNSYLKAEERRGAAVIYRALSAADNLVKSGVREPEKLKNKMLAVFGEEKDLVIDYVEIADTESLAPLDVINGKAVILVAVRIGRTRLIDNFLIL